MLSYLCRPSAVVYFTCVVTRRRLYGASDLLAAASWELHNQFRVASSGSSSSSGGGGAATALSWRQPAPGLPPLLVAGTAQAGAQIWFYQQQLMRWELATTLGSPQVTLVPAIFAARQRLPHHLSGDFAYCAADLSEALLRFSKPTLLAGLWWQACGRRGVGTHPGAAI